MAVDAEAETKAAGTKAKAIAAVVTPGDDMNGIGGDDGPYTLSVSRSREGTAVKVTDSELDEDDDPKFSPMDLGGGRYVVDRTMDADDEGNVVEEVVVVRTDIARPKTPRFAIQYVLNADDAGESVPLDDGEAGEGAVGYDPGGVLSGTDDNLARMMADDWAAATGTTVVHSFDDEDEVDGTFHGASGTYTCVESRGCTVTVNDKGMLTAATDGWVFFPASGARAVVADADFLSYGAWLKRTTDTDGVLTYNDVETFAMATGVTPSNVDDVVGTATYKGGAAGVYVHNVLDSAGETMSATGGHFTADAELVANFGGTDVAISKQNTLTGTINNYELSGDETQSWSVELEEGDFESTVNAGTFSGTTKGGGNEGDYSGTFYGVADADTQPGSVAGEFNAHFTNGSVAGGFGATLQKKN